MKILFIFFTLALFTLTIAQPPITKYKDGNGYSIGDSSAPVVLETFFDHLCPYSASAWPIMQKVQAHYTTSKLRFVLHMFPLPYHHNAFYASKAAVVVELYSAGNFWKWLNLIFMHQDDFSGAATANLTSNQVLNLYAQYAQQLGVTSKYFLNGMADSDLEMFTRAAWKYACSRGAYGTPLFILNGVVLGVDSGDWTVQDWINQIDPLLGLSYAPKTAQFS